MALHQFSVLLAILLIFLSATAAPTKDEEAIAKVDDEVREQMEEIMVPAESQNPFMPKFAMKKFKERRQMWAQRRNDQGNRRQDGGKRKADCSRPYWSYY
ncbi:hypothetical protein EVAR_11892_1 [Eumeta japonica]|uniref:Uncharacterized protein n=1 Tax=Eumeta variegata TaxID=151549 RepID=A0A4C1U910_EUMVA|nr:hypothetical protein EVAR_11892_1 [Eumeta japonica]